MFSFSCSKGFPKLRSQLTVPLALYESSSYPVALPTLVMLVCNSIHFGGNGFISVMTNNVQERKRSTVLWTLQSQTINT